ncbi:MAG: response regulator [Candidatus Latescibacterota bacterium]
MGQARILVVDDDPVVLASCRRVLEAEGFEVVVAASADQAVEAQSSGTFDMLLVDVMMPERDGTWLAHRIRSQWPGVPICVMTGYATPETRTAAGRAGAATFLAKPFTPDELLEAVRETLRAGGQE